jgi:hypothetical protein
VQRGWEKKSTEERAESWETGLGGLPVVGGRRVTRSEVEVHSVSTLQAYDGP